MSELINKLIISNTENKSDTYDYYLKADFSGHETQTFLMQKWWKTQYCMFVQERYMEGLEDLRNDRDNIALFFSKLEWTKTFNIGNDSRINGDKLAQRYDNKDLTWLHFSLLSHWTLIRSSQFHINLSDAINVKNSLNENAFHVLAHTLREAPRSDYQDVFSLIATHNIHSLNDKNSDNQTPLDIVKETLKGRINIREIRLVNEDLYENLSKLALADKLENDFSKEKSKSNKLKI